MTTKTLSPETLIRPEILAMTPYKPIKPFHVLSAELGISSDQIVKLDANENPYGASPKSLAALRTLDDDLPIYPDALNDDLRTRLADLLGVDLSQVVLGAGADELIELVFKLFVGVGDAIINCPPTFGMYTFFADIFGAREIVIERDNDYRLDIDAIESVVGSEGAKVVFITSPNNPDGGIISQVDLARLLNLPCMIVLDEAYIAFNERDLGGEFGENNSARLVANHPNLIVLRTFSKWAGLAGLRCGYGILDRSLAKHMLTIKQPYNVNVAARAAALAALDDLPWIQERINWMLDERSRLFDQLAALDFFEPLPSSANFILTEVIGRSAAELKLNLEKRGVLVRYFAKPRLENHIRVSVGTPEQTDRLIQALKEIS